MRNLMSVYKICKSDRNFSSLVFHFTTPFSGCLQKRMSNLCGKNTNSFELLNIFAKKLHHRCWTGLKIGLWLVCKSSRENARPENMCDIGFEKAQNHAGKVNRMSVNAEAAIRRVL